MTRHQLLDRLDILLSPHTLRGALAAGFVGIVYAVYLWLAYDAGGVIEELWRTF